ncbi:MAG: DUF2281 domain-containing protein [Leptolyngbya sp. DLM2.Bin27]|nr:MAG: DUF2281 domain-containing protein [Leptolyngbya sp. DLM2.Bin27]
MTHLETQLLEKLRTLPADKQHEVLDFVEFLMTRVTTPQHPIDLTAAEHHTSETQFWHQASQTSLDPIWDNPEDDVYAQLL